MVPRPVRERIKESIRRLRVRRAPQESFRTPGTMTGLEITGSRKAWGNDGFAADGTYLAQLLGALKSGSPVLACGTARTTGLVNDLGVRRGFKTYCLEQDPEWAEFARRGLQAIAVINAPLLDRGFFYWYEVRCELPRHFALVICDGPFIDRSLGEPHYSAWRYGVLRWLKDTARTFDQLLLDDVDDPRAPGILERWEREFGVKVQRIASAEGELAIVTPGAAAALARRERRATSAA